MDIAGNQENNDLKMEIDSIIKIEPETEVPDTDLVNLVDLALKVEFDDTVDQTSGFIVPGQNLVVSCDDDDSDVSNNSYDSDLFASDNNITKEEALIIRQNHQEQFTLKINDQSKCVIESSNNQTFTPIVVTPLDISTQEIIKVPTAFPIKTDKNHCQPKPGSFNNPQISNSGSLLRNTRPSVHESVHKIEILNHKEIQRERRNFLAREKYHMKKLDISTQGNIKVPSSFTVETNRNSNDSEPRSFNEPQISNSGSLLRNTTPSAHESVHKIEILNHKEIQRKRRNFLAREKYHMKKLDISTQGNIKVPSSFTVETNRNSNHSEPRSFNKPQISNSESLLRNTTPSAHESVKEIELLNYKEIQRKRRNFLARRKYHMNKQMNKINKNKINLTQSLLNSQVNGEGQSQEYVLNIGQSQSVIPTSTLAQNSDQMISISVYENTRPSILNDFSNQQNVPQLCTTETTKNHSQQEGGLYNVVQKIDSIIRSNHQTLTQSTKTPLHILSQSHNVIRNNDISKSKLLISTEPKLNSKFSGETHKCGPMNKLCKFCKAAQTAIRGNFNPVINSGKLSKKWIIDSYIQVEDKRLLFIRQGGFNCGIPDGFTDYIGKQVTSSGIPSVSPSILPLCFECSPRSIINRCNDIMCLFTNLGSLDVFITVKANKEWPEILSNLLPGENADDRPDLIARVFHLKLKAIIDDIFNCNFFGECEAFTYSVSIPDGVPIAHIFVILKKPSKFKTAADIDEFVSAEVPNMVEEPLLCNMVSNYMLHGPCGPENLQATCMEQGRCKEQFPKEFQDTTKPNIDGFPLYRRSSTLKTSVNGIDLDNRYVVPFNKALLLKYNCFLGVEICTSFKSIKYIHDYVYNVFESAKSGLNTTYPLEFDEIQNYMDIRSYNASKAMWRLLQFPTNKTSHSVYRLPVHLPKKIKFDKSMDFDQTELTEWFKLNTDNPKATEYLYTDVPKHFTYKKGWQGRSERGNRMVGRMFTVDTKETERYSLRLLLLHVPGAKSYDDIKTVDGKLYDTFEEAAFHRNLLRTDEEWDKCLEEATAYQKPFRMRLMLAYVCLFCRPSKAYYLWDKFKTILSLDYLENHSTHNAFNFVLHDFNSVFKQRNLQNSDFDLPKPLGTPIEHNYIEFEKEKQEGDRLISLLTSDQITAFERIIKSIEQMDLPKNLFFLDGPAGSGKTYLFNAIISYMRGIQEIVLPFAVTGIAATLLRGGQTVRSGFGLPVSLNESSVSKIKEDSEEAEALQKAKLIIIDEVTMLQKHGLRCINELLQKLMKSNSPFGGKVMVIGGDFHLTLPFAARGNEIDLNESCIKSSNLWEHFQRISLVTNMRSTNYPTFNEWLLEIGSGTIQSSNIPLGTVHIPDGFISTDNNLINEVFGQIETLSTSDLNNRVILCSSNIEALDVNRTVLNNIPGTLFTYYSSDSLVSSNEDDEVKYPVEFLHSLCPSRMPPHDLKLKVGTIVMLLCNLNPKMGLFNGTRLVIKECNKRSIIAEVLSECHKRDIIAIPRIDIRSSDLNLPFIFTRRQFPVTPVFAIEISKAQGQTFEHVGIILNKPVFTHGQLYLALSRAKTPSNIKIVIKETSEQGKLLGDNRVFTKNVVNYQAL